MWESLSLLHRILQLFQLAQRPQASNHSVGHHRLVPHTRSRCLEKFKAPANNIGVSVGLDLATDQILVPTTKMSWMTSELSEIPIAGVVKPQSPTFSITPCHAQSRIIIHTQDLIEELQHGDLDQDITQATRLDTSMPTTASSFLQRVHIINKPRMPTHTWTGLL